MDECITNLAISSKDVAVARKFFWRRIVLRRTNFILSVFAAFAIAWTVIWSKTSNIYELVMTGFAMLAVFWGRAFFVYFKQSRRMKKAFTPDLLGNEIKLAIRDKSLAFINARGEDNLSLEGITEAYDYKGLLLLFAGKKYLFLPLSSIGSVARDEIIKRLPQSINVNILA